MNKTLQINEKWIKASIIGTIWAASEIVLGSFLHNLKIPFSSNVLTAIGIIILISVSYIWTEKGLFWRAGLICALMKTMSPSAVIFGPMIAIFSQAMLLEISVRILGKTVAGYILGAMLAMSWNLFQKIMNFIIFYGPNIVQLYADLIKYAQKQLNIHVEIIWLPILFLLLIYCILGIISATIGMKVGRKILKQPAQYIPAKTKQNNELPKQKTPVFNYSLVWLFLDVVLLVGSFILLNYAWYFWSSSITIIVIVWAIRYKRAIRQLSKPKFWIFFVLITMITAFVFTKMQSDAYSFSNALLIGIQMNFRAVLIIVGFSVLGTELYNPKIRQFFLKTSFQQLPLALELSFESLPSMIANIPDFKTIIKNPVSVIYQIISQANFRLEEIRSSFSQKVFIIAGAIGAGKTTILRRLAETLRENGISVGGIYSPRILEDERTIGYDVIDIVNDTREIFLRIAEDPGKSNIGKYSMAMPGFQMGIDALSLHNNLHHKVVMIDEVGALELADQGWANSLKDLITASDSHLILAVRNSNVDRVIQKWNFSQYFILDVSENDCNTICRSVMEQIK